MLSPHTIYLIFPLPEPKNHQKSFGKLFGNLPIFQLNLTLIPTKITLIFPKIHLSTPSNLPQIDNFLRIQSFPYYNVFIFTLIFTKSNSLNFKNLYHSSSYKTQFFKVKSNIFSPFIIVKFLKFTEMFYHSIYFFDKFSIFTFNHFSPHS